MVCRIGGIAVLTILLLAFKGSHCQGSHSHGYLVGAVTGFADGSNCTWLEQPRTPSVTALVMVCYCRGELPHQLINFICQYEGEPENCPEWMEDKEVFFRHRVAELKGR